MPKKHDWEAIRRDYIQGYNKEDGSRIAEPTYADVSERHGVSANQIRQKGAVGNWTEQRNLFQAKLEHSAQEKRIEGLTEQIVKFDADCASTASSLLQIIRGKMAQAVTVGSDGKRQVVASATDLQALSSALVKAQTVGRLAMGESTENTKTEWAVITPEFGMA